MPVRVIAALLLAAIGWRFARDIGRAMGPRLMRRFDPGTASTVSFLLQLLTLLVIVVFALRIVDLNPRAIALGGAVTAVVIGLAAQSTLGNVIAGIMLQASRPFRVGERVRLQGGTLGATVEGTVASQGLIYTVFARGNGTFLVPNNSALSATIVPLRTPAGVDVLARLREGVLPSELEQLLTARGQRADARRPRHLAGGGVRGRRRRAHPGDAGLGRGRPAPRRRGARGGAQGRGRGAGAELLATAVAATPAGCSCAQATISFEPLITESSSVTSTGTQVLPVSRLTSLRRPVLRASGSAPQP